MKKIDPLVRFERLYIPEPNTGCFLWTGSVSDRGYAQFKWEKGIRAQRFIWEKTVGPIAEGLEIDHKCRVRCCVNPKHLQAVTHLKNMESAVFNKPTHCPKGHPYNGGNVRIRKKTGAQVCRQCAREWWRLRQWGVASWPGRDWDEPRSHCPKRHEYNNENSFLNSRGYRQCRLCKNEQNRICRLKKSA